MKSTFFSRAAMAGSLILAGCSSFSADGGMDVPAALVDGRLGKHIAFIRDEQSNIAIHAVTLGLTAKPLTVDDAIQIALYNNRELQATFGDLGIAEADLVQAGRLPNPGFTFKHTHGEGLTTIERSFTFNLISILAAPQASRIERRHLEAVQMQAAVAALKLAGDTRNAYYEAVADSQGAIYAQQEADAADAAADLAKRMLAAGNWSKLDQLRQQLFSTEAKADVVRAASASATSRERLTRLMGIDGDEIAYVLPVRMPDLPDARTLPWQHGNTSDLMALAIAARLDVRAAQHAAQAQADDLGLTRATRFVHVLDVGPVLNSGEGSARAPGYEINLDVPLFDWGEARTHKAETLYMQALNRLATTVLNARSEVRENVELARNRFAIAQRYRDQVIPLRRQISDENLLRYNGMLISAFELLADAREQITDAHGYITALKEYWIADSNLRAALGGAYPDN